MMHLHLHLPHAASPAAGRRRSARLRPLAFTLVAWLGLAAATGAAADDRGRQAVAEAEILSMDQNGDGVLTAAEHAIAARAVFTAMDSNADGRVTATEMAGHARRQTLQRPEGPSVDERLRRLDGDGDGLLTAEEHRAASLAAFAELDTDRNGQVDKAELAVGHAKHVRVPPAR